MKPVRPLIFFPFRYVFTRKVTDVFTATATSVDVFLEIEKKAQSQRKRDIPNLPIIYLFSSDNLTLS